MDYANKRDLDFNKGKFRREHTACDLNKYLEELNTGLRFERMHAYLKTMHISEKVKNNKLKNYLQKTTISKAMALHYVLTKENKLNKIPFIFMYRDGGGFYLKIPKEYKEDVETYLKILTELDYHFIIIDKKKYSYPTPLKTICNKPWNHKMSESKGNKNRLQFYGKLSKIIYRHPEERDLQGTIIERLDELIK